MIALRRLVLHRRHLFAALIVVVLAMRMLTPTGYMFAVADGVPTVMPCRGGLPVQPQPYAPPMMSMAIPAGHAMAMPGTRGDHDNTAPDQAGAPCAFAGMAWAAIAATDPLLLAVAIAFVMLLGTRGVARPRQSEAPHLRPPLRGPPARA